MKRYKKEDIQTHSEHFRAEHPAVNVKCRQNIAPYKIAEHFGCSEDQAEKASEYAFQAAQEQFWESVQDTAREILKDKTLLVYSEGRSGGWLVVHGLDDLESWDAVAVTRWNKFEKAIRAEVDYVTSKEHVFEDIAANEWHRDGSELYNFIDTKEGKTVLIPDLKEYIKKHEQGYLATA